MRDLNDRMEQFSRAYVQGVCAAAGCLVGEFQSDMDSVDLSIRTRAETSYPIRPQIDVQLKSTMGAQADGEALSFPLKLKNYNDLRARTAVPRYLVLVLLPDSVEEWATHDPSGLVLRRCGYWLSLEGQPETKNENSVTVKIPTANLFGPHQLRHLMTEVQRRWQL